MARKNFDLTNRTKQEIFNGGRLATLAGMVGIVAAPLMQYRPDFGDYVQFCSVGALAGFMLSLTVSALRDMQSDRPAPPRRSFGVQSYSDSAALPEVAGDDYITINTQDGPRSVRKFEAALSLAPDGFAGAYNGAPRNLKMRGLRDLFWPQAPQPLTASRLVAPRPVEREEVYFWSCGVQLSGAVVWRFLRYAESNRAKGKGLSERYWKERNRSEWWVADYYDPMIALLDYASRKSRVQLVIMRGNQWRVLARDCKTTYKILMWAAHGVG